MSFWRRSIDYIGIWPLVNTILYMDPTWNTDTLQTKGTKWTPTLQITQYTSEMTPTNKHSTHDATPTDPVNATTPTEGLTLSSTTHILN